MNANPDRRALAGLVLLGVLIWLLGWFSRGWWARRRKHDQITGNVVELRSRPRSVK